MKVVRQTDRQRGKDGQVDTQTYITPGNTQVPESDVSSVSEVNVAGFQVSVKHWARCTRVHVLWNRSRGYYDEVNGEVYTCACTGEQIKWLL